MQDIPLEACTACRYCCEIIKAIRAECGPGFFIEVRFSGTEFQEGGIDMASEFAKALAQKQRAWEETDWIKYKALLSVAGHPSLQDALQLMHGLDDYDLRPDVAATWDYAAVVLREKYPELPEELFQTPQAAQVGQRMLEERHAVITDYGLLRRKDNGHLPVFQEPSQEPQETYGPQMEGM